MKYRKKPVVIEAMQYLDAGMYPAILAFCRPGCTPTLQNDQDLNFRLIIPTLEGDHVANKGDWIVKGIKGECYPVKPDIFEMTYEKVEDDFPGAMLRQGF